MTTATLYHRDGSQKVFTIADISRMVGCGQVGPGREWSSVAPPPANFDRIVPKYKVTRDVRPPQRARYRFEPPFTTIADSDIWQYSTRAYTAGEVVSTTDWPHESFQALNFSAEKVLTFYKGALRSRLPTSPWHLGKLRLDTGVSGPATPDVRPPNVKPMDLRPVA